MDAWEIAVRRWTAEQRAAGKAETTIRLWRYYLSRWAREFPDPWTTDRDGHTRPVNRDDIITWLAAPAWSPSTRKSARSALVSFYTWGRAARAIRRNLAASSPRSVCRGGIRDQHPITSSARPWPGPPTGYAS